MVDVGSGSGAKCMGVSLRNIVREPHRADSLSLAICHRRVYHGRPFLSAPANSLKPSISTPVRPPRRFALQICADRNACTSIWRLSLFLPPALPRRFLLFSCCLFVSRSRPSLPRTIPIYRKSCRQSSVRATTSAGSVAQRMVTRVVNNFFVLRFFSSFLSFLSPSLRIFLFAPSFFLGRGTQRFLVSPLKGSLFCSLYMELTKINVTGSSDTKLCVVFRETSLCVIYSFIGEQQEVLYAR